MFARSLCYVSKQKWLRYSQGRVFNFIEISMDFETTPNICMKPQNNILKVQEAKRGRNKRTIQSQKKKIQNKKNIKRYDT
jgi:hypothetical protein